MPALVKVKSQARIERNQKKHLSRIVVKLQDLYTCTHLHGVHYIPFVLILVGLYKHAFTNMYTHIQTSAFIHIHSHSCVCISTHVHSFEIIQIDRYTNMLKTYTCKCIQTQIHVAQTYARSFTSTHIHDHVNHVSVSLCLIMYDWV